MNQNKPIHRCNWAESHELLTGYHDREWGVPLHDDRGHFEFLVLEINQAGLSWLTVLKKREALRKAFDGFDPSSVARFDEARVTKLLADCHIIRNRRKIEAAIHNAGRVIEVQRQFGSFDNFLWGFVDHRPVINSWQNESEIPASTPLSDKVVLGLKNMGFKFVGTTIVYAHLQAAGLVNDHLVGCFRYSQLVENRPKP